MDFIKVSMHKDAFEEVISFGGKYLARILPVEDGENIECVECMLDSYPSAEDIELLKEKYVSTMLPLYKAEKIREIESYDISSEVNSFTYDGNVYWLDKVTRNGLKQSTSDEMSVGRTETTLILGDLQLVLPCEQVVQMLIQLEVYAKDCYNVTAQHKIAVKSLTSIEDVVNYDHTQGYPEKIVW